MCADSKHPISELLRKAQYVSMMLSVKMATDWVKHEASGYKDDPSAIVPSYRHIPCQIKYHNPIHGMQNVIFVGERPTILKKVWIVDSCPYLEEIASAGDELSIPFSDRENAWMWSNDPDYRPLRLPGHKVFTTASIQGILHIVRTRIMEWAIALHHEGITGMGRSFTSEDKERAITVTNGVFNSGNISVVDNTSGGSNVAVNQSSSSYIDIGKVMDFIHTYDQESPSWKHGNKSEVDQQVNVLRSESRSSSPDQNKIRSALSAICRLTEGVSAGIIASGIYAHVGTLLGS